MLNVAMLNVVMLNVDMLNVVMLSVVMLNVVASFQACLIFSSQHYTLTYFVLEEKKLITLISWANVL
jgi:hypothetical protein